jgi:hypothetical protein
MSTGPLEGVVRSVLVDDVEELALSHRSQPSPKQWIVTDEPSAYPSDEAGTTTKPDARVTEERTDDPEIAIGSTRSPMMTTLA